MGRKKIKIANIENNRQKHITFMRRKAGIIKKCHELAVLCNAKVMLMVWDGTALPTIPAKKALLINTAGQQVKQEDRETTKVEHQTQASPTDAQNMTTSSASSQSFLQYNYCHVYATHSAEQLLRAYEAASLGLGEARMAEYQVEQIGEGSEDLVVRRVHASSSINQLPFMRRDRNIPRILEKSPSTNLPSNVSAAVADKTTVTAGSIPWNDLTPDQFRPPSIAEIERRILQANISSTHRTNTSNPKTTATTLVRALSPRPIQPLTSKAGQAEERHPILTASAIVPIQSEILPIVNSQVTFKTQQSIPSQSSSAQLNYNKYATEDASWTPLLSPALTDDSVCVTAIKVPGEDGSYHYLQGHPSQQKANGDKQPSNMMRIDTCEQTYGTADLYDLRAVASSLLNVQAHQRSSGNILEDDEFLKSILHAEML